MKTNMNRDFEDIIREKANSFEFEYDAKEWSKLNKKLKKNNPFSTKNISIISAIVISVATISILTFNSNKPTIKSATSNKNNISTQSSIIENSSIQTNTTPQTESNTKADKTNTSISNYTDSPKEVKQPIIQTTEQKTIENSETNKVNNLHNASLQNKSNVGIADFSINQNHKEACTPIEVEFNGKTNHQSASYLWDFGDGASASGYNVSHVYSISGNYKVTLVVNAENNEFTYTSNIIAKETPKIDISWTNKMNLYTFKSNQSDASGFEWKLNNVVIGENSDEFENNFAKSDAYKISLTAKNSNGCSVYQEKILKVDIEYFIFPNTFTPNDDGINDYFGPVGELPSDIKYHLTIFDKQGNIIFESEDPNKKWDGINYKTNKKATTTSDIFVYKVVTKDSFNKEHIKTGHVTVLVN